MRTKLTIYFVFVLWKAWNNCLFKDKKVDIYKMTVDCPSVALPSQQNI